VEGVRRASQVGVGPRNTDRRTSNGGLTVDVGSFELPKSRSTGLIVGAVGLLLVLGAGAYFALAGGDQHAGVQPEPGASNTAGAASGATSHAPASPTPTAPAPSLPTTEPTTPTPAPTPPEDKKPAEPAEVAPVRVQIASTPTGAEVHNDGALLGRTPFTIDRPKAGEPALDLVLKLSGFKDAPVRVSAYTQEQLTITLTRRWTPAPPAPVRAITPKPEPAKPADDSPRPRPRPPTEVLDPWN
jgi:PEGA domain-containing protein